MENKYFIILVSDGNFNTIINDMVEDVNTLRYSLDNSKVVVKLPSNTSVIPAILDDYTVYNHSEILTELNTSDWNPNI